MTQILNDSPRIVVLDDVVAQAEPLVVSLAKKGVPCVHYRGLTSGVMPAKPLVGVRIVFLDFHLGGTHGTSIKNVVSGAIGNLKKVISKENGPWLLVTWSEFADRIDLPAFVTSLHGIGIGPIKAVKLDKVAIKNSLTRAAKELKATLKELGPIEAIIGWETAVRQSAVMTANELLTELSPDADGRKRRFGCLVVVGAGT